MVWTNATRQEGSYTLRRLRCRRCCSTRRRRRYQCWLPGSPGCGSAGSPPPSPSSSNFYSPPATSVLGAHQRPKRTRRRERRSSFDVAAARRGRVGHRPRAANRPGRGLGVLERTLFEGPVFPRRCAGWRARWLRKLARGRRHGGGPFGAGGQGKRLEAEDVSNVNLKG